ncbi:hypothetical protein Tco_1444142 [Tanacetum coccineum]
MDLYHSRLTSDDLNNLIIKYKIPRDLHPRLPSKEFVTSELPNDAIDRAAVTLFRVFQTLCKQGDWFSFAKRRASSPVCIDDNRSCMKLWKSGFFLIDRRAIPDAMVWRHPDAAIDDPWPAAGSFNMVDVRRLSAHVIKLRDMPEDVLVLSGLSQVWKNHFCDPVLWGANGNVMSIYDFLCLLEWTGVEVQEEPHLDVRPTLQRLPFYCTSPAAANAAIRTLLHRISPLVPLVPRLLLRLKLLRSKRPLLLVPLQAMLLTVPGNQGWSFVAFTTEGSNTQDSRGKGIMVDDTAAPYGGVSRQRPSSGPAPSFRNVSGDAIHTDFFPFSVGPYYATYPEDDVAGNCEFTREE